MLGVYFLWHLGQMSLKGRISSVGGSLFSMVMQEDFFMELLFLDDNCLGKVTGSKKEVVIEVFVWVV